MTQDLKRMMAPLSPTEIATIDKVTDDIRAEALSLYLEASREAPRTDVRLRAERLAELVKEVQEVLR